MLKGSEPLPFWLISFTTTVPASVKSVFQSSKGPPFTRAEKNNVPSTMQLLDKPPRGVTNTVPASVPSLFHIPSCTPSVALKYTPSVPMRYRVSSTFGRPKTTSPPLTRTVPDSVPSLFHRPSPVVKNSVPFTSVKPLGDAPKRSG